MTMKESILTYYDDVAENYGIKHGVDRYGWEWGVKTYYGPLIQRFIPQHSAILDIGCGTGKFTGLLKNTSSDIKGIDLSPKMIEVAKRRVPGAQFIVGDCESLDAIADQSVDVVTAFNTFSYYPNKAKAIGSIHRVLRNGGIFFDLDMNGLCPIYYLSSVLNRNEMKEWYRYIKESTLSQLVPLFREDGFDLMYTGTLCWVPNALDKIPVTALIPLDMLFSHIPLVRQYAMRVILVGKKK